MKYYESKIVETYHEAYITDDEKEKLINSSIEILNSNNIYRRGFKTIGVKQVNTENSIENMYYHQYGFPESYYVLKIELSSKNFLVVREDEHPQLFELFHKRFDELWKQEQQEGL